MSPEMWREARQIFEDALDKEPASRETFVRESCKGDQRLFEEVASLLASYKETDDVFLKPVIEGITSPDRMEGRELGPYRILHRLGQGGMGAVYLGERADDQFRRRVAIKLIRPGYGDGHLLRRFSNERQLLAVLEHPNIIKLLDAGVTDDDIPYFVMDYVEGQPIDQYCDSRALSIRERLALFRQVCDAVHCAHRNLVVHRDLKPSNILVTPDGQLRLLDFGIAKLLRPEYGSAAIGLTRTTQPMTPEYASPEQVTGQPITTSSDIYSLGVLLYRLIAGRHPYEMNTSSAADVERVICQTNPERPTTIAQAQIAKKLGQKTDAGIGRKTETRIAAKSDLDNIVLMAMRKEPQRRYASAEHLSEDIRRYLANQPVTARKDTVWYRTSKFVARNTVAVGAATLGLAALIGIAEYAWHEKTISESRLAELRNTTTFMMFDLNDEFRHNGAIAGRKMLVSKGLELYDKVAAEAGNDERLKRQTAYGYMQAGDILGNPTASNFGDRDAARQSYQKELAIGQSLKPGPETNIILGAAHVGLGRLDAFAGNRKDAERHFEVARPLYEAAATLPASRHGLMVIAEQMGNLRNSEGNVDAAIHFYGKSFETARELDRTKSTAETQRDVQTEAQLYGLALAGARRFDEALKVVDDSLEIATRQAASLPAMRRNVAAVYGYRGYVLALADRLDEAIDAYGKSVGIFEVLFREDPRDNRARTDLGQMQGEMAGVEWNAKHRDEASKRMSAALETLQPVVNRLDALPHILRQYAQFLLAPSNQRPNATAALKYIMRADKLEHHANPATLETLASAYAAMHDNAHAQQAAKDGLAVLASGADVNLRKQLEAWLSVR